MQLAGTLRMEWSVRKTQIFGGDREAKPEGQEDTVTKPEDIATTQTV